MAKKKNEEYSDDDQGYGDEPNFDDPKGYADDVADEGVCVCKIRTVVTVGYYVPAWLSRPPCT